MNIEKSLWVSHGDTVSLSVPFTKVNRERRTVSGFATLDNVDQTGDVVTAEASLKAFEGFRGNIREMHMPVAVGKLLSFKPETFYDAPTQKFYNGVYVETYVSKGAQDTWEKVLDGTLTGFSIGGRITESDNQVNKADGTSVRFIKAYDLVELSIVDSPANELCNIISISKSNDGQLVFKGMAAEIKTENIFYCEDSDSVFVSTEKTYESPITGKPAALIGWVEQSDTNKAKEINRILDSFKKSRLPLPANQANAQGGMKVSDTNIEKAVQDLSDSATAVVETPVAEAPVVEAPVAEEAPAVEETVVAEDADSEDTPEDVVEKAADISEVETIEPDFAKALVDLKGFFSETLSKAAEANATQVSAIKETVETFSKSVEGRISELTEQHATLSKAVADIKNTMNSVEKRVDAVEADTAIKKSTDLGGSAEVTIKKSKWNGSFLGSVDELFN
jgi:hypothetical protein